MSEFEFSESDDESRRPRGVARLRPSFLLLWLYLTSAVFVGVTLAGIVLALSLRWYVFNSISETLEKKNQKSQQTR